MKKTSKFVQIINSENELKQHIAGFVGADCWGCYIQKNWENGADRYDINEKYVYYDSFNNKDENREKLYTVDSDLMQEIVDKINNNEILTLVLFSDQSYGDVSFFKVDDKYILTRFRSD